MVEISTVVVDEGSEDSFDYYAWPAVVTENLAYLAEEVRLALFVVFPITG